MKSYRQAAILEIVDHDAIHTQEALRRKLRGRGFDATQATLSRDIKELGLVKRAGDGAYQRAGTGQPDRPGTGEAGLRRAAAEYLRRVDQVQQFLVIRTDPAQAQPLAVSIDRAQPAEVVGTIAGDDTILVIARDSRRAAAFAKRLEHWARA
jgi:transcriptional regulator of arginine metabolism